MIITRQKLKEVTGVDYYDGRVIHSRLAYKFFRDRVSATGDVITFVAPAQVETEYMCDLEDLITKDFIYSESMIHICYELPSTNLWGGIAFQRLYNTMLGDALAKTIKAPVEVAGDDIFVVKEFKTSEGIILPKGKASVSIVTEKNGAVLGHTGINITAGAKAPSFAYSTNMTPEQVEEFQKTCVKVFHDTVKSIFVASTKVI